MPIKIKIFLTVLFAPALVALVLFWPFLNYFLTSIWANLPGLIMVSIASFLFWIRKSYIGLFVLLSVFFLSQDAALYILVALFIAMERIGEWFLRPLPNNKTEKKNAGFHGNWVVSGGLGLVAAIGILIANNVITDLYAAKHVAIFEKINGIPEMDPLYLLPEDVAYRYATDTFQNPQESLGFGRTVLIDGQLKKVFPRLPEGFVLSALKKLGGFALVDVSIFDRKVEVVDAPFVYSEGQIIFDNLYYQLAKHNFGVHYSKPLYLKDPSTGQWITVVPYIAYKHFPFQVPVWGGFMTVQPNGEIRNHKPEEAATLAVTAGNPIYPKYLADYYADVYAYKNGLINKWFIHEDQTDVELFCMCQPFSLPTKQGFKYAMVGKPYGNSFGIFKIFIFDATTGEKQIVEFNQDTLLSGPDTAVDYVKRALPQIDYTDFVPVSPHLVVRGDKIYWLVYIIEQGGAGVAYAGLVDAQTAEVFTTTNYQEIVEFLNK